MKHKAPTVGATIDFVYSEYLRCSKVIEDDDNALNDLDLETEQRAFVEGERLAYGRIFERLTQQNANAVRLDAKRFGLENVQPVSALFPALDEAHRNEQLEREDKAALAEHYSEQKKRNYL